MIIPPSGIKLQRSVPVLAERRPEQLVSDREILIPHPLPTEEQYQIKWPWQVAPNPEADRTPSWLGSSPSAK